MERKKLDLQINSPVNLQLLFDKPIVSENKFGPYYMYGVTDGQNEFNFFAPQKVHEQLGKSKRGTAFTLTKTATQKGKKLFTDYKVKFLDNGKQNETKSDESENNGYYQAMLQSYAEATKIQSKFSAVNLNQCAVTLFIAKTKTNGFNNF